MPSSADRRCGRNADGDDDADSIEALSPGIGGRWLVTTRTSRHIWDLDQMTCERIPGPDSRPMRFDREKIRIMCIAVYPAVGRSSYVFYDHPVPGRADHWRVSATILSIKRLPGDGAAPDS